MSGFKKKYCVLSQIKTDKYKDKKMYHIGASINQNKIVLVTTTSENGGFKATCYKGLQMFYSAIKKQDSKDHRKCVRSSGP